MYLCRNGKESKGGKALAGLGGIKLFTQEQDLKLKNLLKRTYLRRWIGRLDGVGDDTEVYGNSEGKFFSRRSNSMDLARLVKMFVIHSLNSMTHACRFIVATHPNNIPLSCPSPYFKKFHKIVLFLRRFFVFVIVI